MDQKTITLIVGLVGILATLTSSLIGHYFTAKARSNPFRQLLYAKQLELVTKLVHRQSRFKIFAVILIDNTSYIEQAENDMRDCVKVYSELTEEGAVLLPVEIYVEIRELNRWMVDFLIRFDEGKELDKDLLDEFAVIDLKIALIVRGLLGVDELSEGSISVFSSKKKFKRVIGLERSDLNAYINERKKNSEGD
jgi:hypothetical protein